MVDAVVEAVKPGSPDRGADDLGALTRSRELFSFLDRQRIAWCVVGDCSDLERTIHSDIDIVVDGAALPGIAALLAEFARASGARLVQAIRHEAVACYYILAWRGEGGIGFLHPDVCSHWWRGGRLFIDAPTMLADRRRDPAGFMRPSPGRNAVYYLLKRLSKGALDAPRAAFIRTEWNAEPDQARALASRCLPAAAVERLADACESGDWRAIIADLPRWQRAVNGGVSASIGARLQDLARRIGRARHPTGLLVEVDADVSGARADVFLGRWRRAFRRTLLAPPGGSLAALRLWPTLAHSALILRQSPSSIGAVSSSWGGARLRIPAAAWRDGTIDQIMLDALSARVHARLGIPVEQFASGVGVGWEGA